MIYQFIYLILLSFFHVKVIVNRVTLYVLVSVRFCFSVAPCKAVYKALSRLPWIEKLKKCFSNIFRKGAA